MKERLNADQSVSWWDKNAPELMKTFDWQGGPHREVLLNPVMLELIGQPVGKRVLDAGCGDGYLSRILAEMGASIVAIDYSKTMLDIARERTRKNTDIEYKHGNFENLDFLPDESFDIIVSNMVLIDVPGYELAIKEAHRLLAQDGYFIFSISHPCFTFSVHGWVKNESKEKLYWMVDRYFEEGVYRVPYNPDHPQLTDLPQFHRTLSSYYQTVTDSGFSVEKLVEPTPQREKLEKYPGFIDDFRMCEFLVFKARKRLN